MDKDMGLYEAIKKRKSVRKYKEESLDHKIKDEINKYILQCNSIYEGQELTLTLVDNTNLDNKNKAGLGFAGGLFKINAPHFIVAVSKSKEGFLENAGYVQEQLVLKLTKMGIATCWLGTYDEKYLRQLLNLKESQSIINVIALGYEYEGKSLASSIRNIAGAYKRKSIDEFVYYKEFGNSIRSFAHFDKTLENICTMSSLCPSANNGQPIYVVLDEKSISVFIKSKEGGYKDKRRLDAGIFITHLYLACLQEGYNIKLNNVHFKDNNYKIPNEVHLINSFTIDKE